MKTLRAEGLEKSFKKRKVVKGVSLEVRSGEVVGLLGPNGAGKTTTFYMIAGLLKPEAGKIWLNEREITSFSLAKRAKLGLTYLPQERSVFRELTVEKNILGVLELKKLGREEREQRKEAIIQEFGLEEVAGHKGYTLSGGEARRVEIARAVAVEPDFILLDEPFAGIDPLTVKNLQKLILELKEKGIGILISDHNVRETLKICDRAYLLYQGEILVTGTAQEIAQDQKAKSFYLGQDFNL
ncbi:MAG TPA: LPS export ABC transporter ATP-binding protein [Thermodesulfatator atlanticus]|uniref:LPS export ABC transporter ATP-binding protein n=1 Tax=Thermodesulfatator atlanticus TaxID=501497 RepID=A0A7V5P1Z1_9BACT|nr:LPS export ABC transporter ATP-binding protein [Thermodesulfatator atlanticus]